jgi:hypothetical protein
MQHPIVPFNQFAHAASVARLRPNTRANYPYAAQFFKTLYGTTRPTVLQLTASCCHHSNREKLYHALNELLRSEGQIILHPLGIEHAHLYFPYILHRQEQRLIHRWAAKDRVARRIDEKHHQTGLERAYQALDQLTPSELPDWCDEHCVILTTYEINAGLRRYFSQHNTTSYEFAELYPDCLKLEPWQLANAIRNDISEKI